MARTVTPIRPLRTGERRTFRALDGELVQVEKDAFAFNILNMAGDVVHRVPLKQAASLIAMIPEDGPARP